MPHILPQTDFSAMGIAAVLSQHGADGKEHVVAYASRRTTTPESQYSSYEGELLAVLFAVEKFQPYIYGSFFDLVVDNTALVYLNKGKRTNAKLARWALRLQELDVVVIHRPGRHHANVDGLSRAYPHNQHETQRKGQNTIFAPMQQRQSQKIQHARYATEWTMKA